MKDCAGCWTVKENSEFTKDNSRKDGLRVFCKKCCSDQYKGTFIAKGPRPSECKVMPIQDIHYLAALVEGEGCFSATKGERGWSRRLRVEMTDEDILHYLKKITGVGSITGPYYRENWKPIWHWSVNKKADLEVLLGNIYPIMGIRRKAQIDKLFQTF